MKLYLLGCLCGVLAVILFDALVVWWFKDYRVSAPAPEIERIIIQNAWNPPKTTRSPFTLLKVEPRP